LGRDQAPNSRNVRELAGRAGPSRPGKCLRIRESHGHGHGTNFMVAGEAKQRQPRPTQDCEAGQGTPSWQANFGAGLEKKGCASPPFPFWTAVALRSAQGQACCRSRMAQLHGRAFVRCDRENAREQARWPKAAALDCGSLLPLSLRPACWPSITRGGRSAIHREQARERKRQPFDRLRTGKLPHSKAAARRRPRLPQTRLQRSPGRSSSP
jgi:hypothetical protein